MKKLFLLLLMPFLFTGCITLPQVEKVEKVEKVLEIPEHKKSISFQIGIEQQANLGAVMIEDADLFFYKGFIISADYQPPASKSKTGIIYPVIKEGTMLKLYGTLKNGAQSFEAIDYRPQIYTGEQVKWDFCLAVKDGVAYGDSACGWEYVVDWPTPLPLKESKVFRKGSFKTEIIYNGKSKDTIRLSYREFKDDFARPAFNQDLSYDLSESKTIGFKNMKIEVIEATNSYIKFIVQSPIN